MIYDMMEYIFLSLILYDMIVYQIKNDMSNVCLNTQKVLQMIPDPANFLGGP
jgi:hypothetical protein